MAHASNYALHSTKYNLERLRNFIFVFNNLINLKLSLQSEQIKVINKKLVIFRFTELLLLVKKKKDGLQTN